MRRLLWFTLSMGCSVSVRGEIDGRVPELTEALYGEASGRGGTGIVLSLSSDGLGCEERQAFVDSANALDPGPDFSEDLAELYRAFFPAEYWRAAISAVSGTYVYGDFEETFEIAADNPNRVAILRFVDYPDASFFDATTPASDFSDRYEADLGEAFTLRRSGSDSDILGSFEADFDDAYDNDAGRIRVEFRARYCPVLDGDAARLAAD